MSERDALDLFDDEDEDRDLGLMDTRQLDKTDPRIKKLLGDEADPDPDESDESESETTPESSESDPSVDAVLNHISRQEDLKRADEANWKEQWAYAQTLLSDYQPPPDALSKVEEAAVVAASLEPGSVEFDAFRRSLEDANAKLVAEAAGEEFDAGEAAGEPVGERFDPMSLDSRTFETYMRAVAAGGAIDNETPAGYSRQQWHDAVASSLGR